MKFNKYTDLHRFLFHLQRTFNVDTNVDLLLTLKNLIFGALEKDCGYNLYQIIKLPTYRNKTMEWYTFVTI